MSFAHRKTVPLIVALTVFLGLVAASHAINVEPAPAGDATSVATSVIKANFDSCKRVTKATRQKDGSIYAKCSGIEYLVFTLKNPKTSKAQPVALNCEAAKTRLGISCRK
jgi:hypothetical protein